VECPRHWVGAEGHLGVRWAVKPQGFEIASVWLRDGSLFLWRDLMNPQSQP